MCIIIGRAYVYCSIFARAEAMAAEIKELQGEMADINTVRRLCIMLKMELHVQKL